MSQPKEFLLARLVGKVTIMRAEKQAADYAKQCGCSVYAYRTPTGYNFDVIPPMGECIIAQPSGVVHHKGGHVV